MHRLVIYLRKRAKSIHSILEKPEVEYSTNTFHKLRVEIKKVKALFDLIYFCSEDFEFEKHFRPFKEIFVLAGKVRELQLEEQLLNKYRSSFVLNEYRNTLSSKLFQEERSYFAMINQELSVQLDNKFQIITSILSKIHKKEGNCYIEKKRKDIQKLLSEESLKANDLHNLRKQIKILDYNQKSLSSKEEYHSESNYDQLTKLLGKWHDCQIFINHLNIIMEADTLNLEEKSQIKNLKSKISSKRERYFNKIEVIMSELKLLKKQ